MRLKLQIEKEVYRYNWDLEKAIPKQICPHCPKTPKKNIVKEFWESKQNRRETLEYAEVLKYLNELTRKAKAREMPY